MKSNNGAVPEGTRNDLKRRAYVFALDIIKFIDTLDHQDRSAGVIAKQLIRSATSIGANIVEAQAGSTRKDFTNFFFHALKSSNESKFWLGLLRDSRKSDLNLTEKLLQETRELSNILASSILTLKGKKG